MVWFNSASQKMASLLEDPRTYYIAGGALVTCIGLIAARRYRLSQVAKKAAERRKVYPANTVILHQIGRGPYAPSMSPYPLKLETYLRMAKIPYQNEQGMEMSSKGKTPWITYNGEEMADSQFCIDFLNKKLNKDLSAHLNIEQRAIARAMRKMTEESFYWIFIVQRWVYNIDNYKLLKAFPGWTLQQMSKDRGMKAYCQGYGRHTPEEVHAIGRGDLGALSGYLGEKPFLMGDQPCEEDSAIFGMLAQIKWHAPGTPLEKMVKEEFPNLSAYCDRIKDHFWPDWDECNTAGRTKQATK